MCANILKRFGKVGELADFCKAERKIIVGAVGREGVATELTECVGAKGDGAMDQGTGVALHVMIVDGIVVLGGIDELVGHTEGIGEPHQRADGDVIGIGDEEIVLFLQAIGVSHVIRISDGGERCGSDFKSSVAGGIAAGVGLVDKCDARIMINIGFNDGA